MIDEFYKDPRYKNGLRSPCKVCNYDKYNKEYYALIKEILIGRIGITNGQFREEAIKRRKAGRRSAYANLCMGKKNPFLLITDFLCLLFSAGLLVLPIIIFIFYFSGKGIEWLG